MPLDVKKSPQHFVPQLILRNFTFNKKNNQVWVFNKKTSAIFKSNIRNVAAEKGFYDIVVDGQEFSFDPRLSQLEDLSAPIIKRIIRQENLRNVTTDERLILSHFFASQYARTKQLRLLYEDLSKKIEKFLRQVAGDSNRTIEGLPVAANVTKQHVVASLGSDIGEYAPYFFIKDWILLKTDQHNPFWISDNPIAMDNSIDHTPLGNIGFAVEGIEIYFPLSKALTLLILCDTTAKKVCLVYEQLLKIRNLPPEMLEQLSSNSLDIAIARSKLVSDGIRTKNAMNIPYDYLTRLNYLQVAYASEFIFSSTRNFELAQKVIEYDPKYKEGPKFAGSD